MKTANTLKSPAQKELMLKKMAAIVLAGLYITTLFI